MERLLSFIICTWHTRSLQSIQTGVHAENSPLEAPNIT